jgi:GNAT superfamily N-acetyltransferase
VSTRIQLVPTSDGGELIAALAKWTPAGCYVGGLHPGDVGWQLRLADNGADCGLLWAYDDTELVAVALQDSPNTLRPLVRPDRVLDLEVAATLVEYVDGMPRDSPAFTEAACGSAFRSLLSANGWALDPDPWVALYRPLSAADGHWADPLSSRLMTDEDIADRVAVQRAAFAGSTFTVARWHQMAAGPGFDRAYEFLRRDADGAPVAAATGWSAGSGRCAILEPVGTDPAHSGQGHGKAVSLQAIAALARGGSSGVTVWTPAFNIAAIRTYESCGLRQVEIARAMMRPSS